MALISREALNNKLRQLNSEFVDSDMLFDFVMVMVENQKPKDYIKAQLLDLTTEEEASAIAEWIFENLSKQPIGNCMLILAPTAKLLQNALQQTVQNDSEDKNDLRNLLRGKTSSRFADRNERRSNRSSPYSIQKKERKEVSIPRCTFFPNCTREDCQFFHPTEPCPDGENCTKGPACRFIHQVVTPPKSTIACKFQEHCTNPNCTFSHPSPAALAYTAAATKATQQCKFYPNCLNAYCPFYHPPATSQEPNQDSIPQDLSKPVDPAVSQIPCKYDAYCKRPNCHFLHQSRSGAHQSKNKVLIVGNTSARTYALPENEVERVEVDMEVDSK
ncbi:hypothetical protein HK103_006627 [Boothiomyces macroporosus]|uniref:C3H1-type domain-containing protein n=1 Tax=Boothiomyces macroporosus TaxID=261099 RepID=A0AAD5Y4J2_9FUNG|nr:hypothetical protein HK103_006627 [Boothiomyces macroporosus]